MTVLSSNAFNLNNTGIDDAIASAILYKVSRG